MWIVIDGNAGSGKTWLQTRLLRKLWLKGRDIHANYQIKFNKENEGIFRFFSIEETYHLNNCVLGFDEMQDLVGHWITMPIMFRNKIAHHRHNFLEIYCNTQDFNDLHVELRRNVHERYRCESMLRIPRDDSIKPIFQIIRVTHKKRVVKADNDNIKFQKIGRSKLFFLSRLWTREFYNTHADIEFNRFICQIYYEKKQNTKMGKWIVKLYSRDMVSRGKARL